MKLQKLFLIAVTVFVFGETANACEPILPFIKVVGGPGLLTSSWIVLLAAVAIKSVIFAFLQRRLSVPHAIGLMVAANIVTTIVGVIVAALIGSGPIISVHSLFGRFVSYQPDER